MSATGPPLNADRAPDHRRAVPWGLLGMLGLVVAIEAAVARDVLDFSDPVSLSWRLAARSARVDAPGRSVLCVGDSLIKHALIPKVIAARSGHEAVNLAVARGPAPATFFLLRRALEAGARPAAVVVDFKPSVLIGGPRFNLRYWQDILTLREGLELARSARSGTFFFETAVGWLLPTFRSRLEIRSNLLAALRGEIDPLHGINRTCWRNWTLNDGANVAAKNPAFTGAVGADDHKKLLTHVFHCHRVNEEYIRRLLAMAAGRDIPVYWLLPPLAPQLQARRDETGADAGYVRFVRSLQDRYPNVTVLDGRHAGYDHTVFVDATHLDGQGAYTLSRDVADVLRRDSAGVAAKRPRWVDLPAYRPCPVEVALEDVEQSRRALSRSATRVR
jgi:hypothetical protein